MQDETSETDLARAKASFLAQAKASFDRRYDTDLPAPLVVPSCAAVWLDPVGASNPARIGPMLALPTMSFSISLQRIDAFGATDLQRHAHEAVHYVQSGCGYSEIGRARCDWRTGDFIYTPPWALHRHYNVAAEPAHLIIIENSKLLEALGLYERETLGLISFEEHLQTQRIRDNASVD